MTGIIERCGDYSVAQFNFGIFRLDGGSMFGSVPKNIWNKRIPADAENCITLATRSLLLRREGTLILIDAGMGDKWSAKARDIYAVRNTPRSDWPFAPADVTDLVLTHLHFDHAGGISTISEDGSIDPVFSNAAVHLQRANLENAKNATPKERASYLFENFSVLDRVQLRLLEGPGEFLPGIVAHRVDGHTRGQQWIEVKGSPALFFATDLIPTSHHLPLPFHMGYDACAETLMREKDHFLARAVQENAIVVFEHDPQVAAATVRIDERGQYAVKQVFEVKTANVP